MTRPKNTKKEGLIEFVIFEEKGRYVGVCLTFDIIEEGTDFLQLKGSLEKAALLHLDCVIDKNLSDDLLNRHAPAEYWKIYDDSIKAYRKKQLDVLFPSSTEQIAYPISRVRVSGVPCN